MNVGYAPPQTYTIPNNAQSPLYPTQQTSPPDSMSPTPSDVSPTSLRMHQYLQYRQPNQYKQIKEPRTPLYVPAVLRPTERYPKHSPLTPPKSLHGSLDSLEGHHQGDMVDDPQQLDPVMENDYFPEEELGEVTGPPTQEHWKVRSALLAKHPAGFQMDLSRRHFHMHRLHSIPNEAAYHQPQAFDM